MPFNFEKTEIAEVILVKPRVFPDERGFFLETYKQSDFMKNGIAVDVFKQDNHSFSTEGVIRGLHYQLPPMEQGKLVRVVKGKVLDFAVDIRKSSKTFLKWVYRELSDENFQMLWIPPGFAHGFIALSKDVHLMYKCTNEYSPHHEGGIRFDDPDIHIDWQYQNPTVSEKDLKVPFLKDAKLFD
ncbi:MAG: dTDP-4-dehydrorhamnose 3,5-epimerase [Spirochaetes bacterium GWB1_36_13]|nr:MAG: dTDP-4-dehydrorhamnose 3,5-epimerase [Spirochaetes bacterium GWB1_36_13]